MQAREHWDGVYGQKRFDQVSWYAPHLGLSMRLIEQLCPQRETSIVDIGGGESTLVDDLVERGYTDLSVLDISETAIDFTKKRLGNSASTVAWHVGDITQYNFGEARFDLWHDRAVFHFLTDSSDRTSYVDEVGRALKPGGVMIVATFGPDGPLKCSGLEVVRYSESLLKNEFARDFELLGSETTEHQTPAGGTQQFLYCWFRKKDQA